MITFFMVRFYLSGPLVTFVPMFFKIDEGKMMATSDSLIIKSMQEYV